MPDSVELIGLYEHGLHNQCSVIAETTDFTQSLRARLIATFLSSLSFYTNINIEFSNDALVGTSSTHVLD